MDYNNSNFQMQNKYYGVLEESKNYSENKVRDFK